MLYHHLFWRGFKSMQKHSAKSVWKSDSYSWHFSLTRWFTVKDILLLGTCDPYFIEMKQWFKKCLHFQEGWFTSKSNHPPCKSTPSQTCQIHARSNSGQANPCQVYSMPSLLHTKSNPRQCKSTRSHFLAKSSSCQGKLCLFTPDFYKRHSWRWVIFRLSFRY